MIGWVVGFLCHIYIRRLFNAKYIFIEIISSISNNLVHSSIVEKIPNSNNSVYYKYSFCLHTFIWKNFTISTYTLLTINIYLRMAPRIEMKQHVPLSSIKTIHKKALPMKSSIFTAEVCAIVLSLNIISRDKYHKFIIFSDSLSVLTSLKNKKVENPLIV